MCANLILGSFLSDNLSEINPDGQHVFLKCFCVIQPF